MKKIRINEKPSEYQIILALNKRNIPFIKIADDDHTQIGYGKAGRRRDFTDLNNSPAYKLSRDKYKTKKFLGMNGLPVPKGIPVKKVEDIENICKVLSFPIVLKPTDSLQGKGITTKINSVPEARKAFMRTKGIFPNLLFEEYIEGDDHRLLVINGKFIAAMKRTHPTITGNGKSTIRVLINKENKKRQINLKEKYYGLQPIKIDLGTKYFLSKQGFDFGSILPKGKTIKVRMNANIKTGGKGINVTDKVHPTIVSLSEMAARLMGLFVAGVDIITKDISLPLKGRSASITEVDKQPDIVIHIHPHEGKPINTADILFRKIFPKSDQAWIPIYINGKISKNQEEINKHLSEKPVKVTQLHEIGSKKELMIKSPSHKLITYLLDPLTTSVYLEAPL